MRIWGENSIESGNTQLLFQYTIEQVTQRFVRHSMCKKLFNERCAVDLHLGRYALAGRDILQVRGW